MSALSSARSRPWSCSLEQNSVCPNGLTDGSSDPVLNFDVFWETFDQHYAFFGERNVDWDAVYGDLFRSEFSRQLDDVWAEIPPIRETSTEYRGRLVADLCVR